MYIIEKVVGKNVTKEKALEKESLKKENRTAKKSTGGVKAKVEYTTRYQFQIFAHKRLSIVQTS